MTKKKFIVTITEYLVKDVEVEAENENEAHNKVREDYLDSRIILSADDYCGYDIQTEEKEEI